jgi:hypothetical protein
VLVRQLRERAEGKKTKPGRYHAHVLKTLSEACHAWVYVMHNAVKHNATAPGVCDPYSSAAYFDGYASRPRAIRKRVDGSQSGELAPHDWLEKTRTHSAG